MNYILAFTVLCRLKWNEIKVRWFKVRSKTDLNVRSIKPMESTADDFEFVNEFL